MSFARLSLKGRALKLLAQREHSRLELQRKLTAHVEEGDDLPAILDELEQRGFISVERVVESVIRSKASRFGTARLVHDLRRKGLDDETVRQAGEQLRDSEHARAWAVWQQKFGSPAATQQERMKQMRFMASRGFGGDVVRKVVDKQLPSDEDC